MDHSRIKKTRGKKIGLDTKLEEWREREMEERGERMGKRERKKSQERERAMERQRKKERVGKEGERGKKGDTELRKDRVSYVGRGKI